VGGTTISADHPFLTTTTDDRRELRDAKSDARIHILPPKGMDMQQTAITLNKILCTVDRTVNIKTPQSAACGAIAQTLDRALKL
jgi:hypothetical protein